MEIPYTMKYGKFDVRGDPADAASGHRPADPRHRRRAGRAPAPLHPDRRARMTRIHPRAGAVA